MNSLIVRCSAPGTHKTVIPFQKWVMPLEAVGQGDPIDLQILQTMVSAFLRKMIFKVFNSQEQKCPSF